jgi:LSD1 subclass zinc finger protein
MISDGLQEAIENILACPTCKGRLTLGKGAVSIRCTSCQRTYDIKEGIPVLFKGEAIIQEEEREYRDHLAGGYAGSDRQSLMEAIGKHHCIPVMRRHAEEFRNRFKPSEWILDIGIGWGWHWAEQGEGARILGMDMSLGNLILAKRILDEDDANVVLICADASALPILENVVSGIWGVQVFQHFPQEVLHQVQTDLASILRNEFVMEIYNLNLPLLHKIIYHLFGKQFHCHGKQGEMELNRRSSKEWTDIWQEFGNGSRKLSHSYSELFFHPDLRFRPHKYPIKLENVIAEYAPKLAALFARQVQIRIEAR